MTDLTQSTIEGLAGPAVLARPPQLIFGWESRPFVATLAHVSSPFVFDPIGVIRSDFLEKFGVPRQSMMVPSAHGVLKLRPDPNFRTALNALETFSHVWLIYIFDRHLGEDWTPTIAPPRIEAPRRVGVFASRSPHRPNPIGLSVAKLERIDLDAANGIEIHLSGVDLLDGTPVLDLKPYLPYADQVRDATGGWAGDQPEVYPVLFSENALREIEDHEQDHPQLRALIAETLRWDPRPRSLRSAMPLSDPATEGKAFGLRIGHFEVKWIARAGGLCVLACTIAASKSDKV